MKTQLEVEAALARAHASVGNIPKSAASGIASKAKPKFVALDEVKRIEAETKHDIMAMVRVLSEQSGEAGKFVHLGATSNDIVDTAAALQFKEAMEIIQKDVDELISAFAALAAKHRDTIMVARTHGQFAIPTTFGFKIAGYLSEMLRHRERLLEVKKRVLVGKMSGAVGTGAAFGSNFLEVQEEVMKQLGLGVEEAATQIVSRDRYAEMIYLLALICTSCERYATEVRNLQRSEIDEVSEAFDVKKQVGSSTMAQKRNPVTSENVVGLARVARAFIIPELESMVLWHERDLTNSSAERFVIPHVFVLTDDILTKMADIFSHLEVKEENMRRNLDSSKGMIMAEAVMIALTGKGMGRQEAHEVIRKASMKAQAEGKDLRQALPESKEVTKHLSEDELTAAMDPENYLGDAPQLVDDVVKKAEKALRKDASRSNWDPY